MSRLFDRVRQIAVLAGCAAALGGGLASTGFLVAEEPGETSSSETVARPGILLMRNGKVVEGRILKSGENFTVQQPNGGQMFVPGSLVSLHCENIREAFQKLRENARQQQSPAACCMLARWCITNQLLSEARGELDQALHLDPAYEEARNLLHRLNELLDPQRAPETRKPPSPAVPASATRALRSATEEVESLGSLPREQAQYFTRKIQPILVNNCAVAGCHGADSETGFRLQRVIPGGDTSRIASERNLAEVLEQIDPRAPRSSPLLTKPRGNHGKSGKPLFAGSRGAEQLNDLRRWVQTVARSTASRGRREEGTGSRAGTIEQVSGIRDGGESESRGRRAARPAPADEPDGPYFPRPSGDPFQVSRDTESPGEGRTSDPFDPAPFNRGAAPRPVRK